MNGYSTNLYVLLKYMVPYCMKVMWIFLDMDVICTLFSFAGGSNRLSVTETPRGLATLPSFFCDVIYNHVVL